MMIDLTNENVKTLDEKGIDFKAFLKFIREVEKSHRYNPEENTFDEWLNRWEDKFIGSNVSYADIAEEYIKKILDSHNVPEYIKTCLNKKACLSALENETQNNLLRFYCRGIWYMFDNYWSF